MAYLIFIRKLTKKKISQNDLNEANELINWFNRKFEELYGKECVTFNLHANLHLVKQVEYFGPITGTSVLEFESNFYF